METVVFDIGKTNKKYFVFDQDFNVLAQDELEIPEEKDDDGFPCDSLSKLITWLADTWEELLRNPSYDIQKINFSTYGASFVHLNKNGQPVLPLYNYLKPMPDGLMDSFYESYDKMRLSLETSSPPLGMLNAGFQIHWIQLAKPKAFQKIAHSLHLPNFISFLFHHRLVSEYTSIGCHTALWDFEQKRYHDWVVQKDIEPLLPKPVAATTSFDEKGLEVGVGIHDSSAALLPYLVGSKNRFLLISTGTWSIVLNPFNEAPLSQADLEADCLEFLTVKGDRVKAARLFLGHEFATQVKVLTSHFGVSKNYFKKVKFDRFLFKFLQRNNDKYFEFRDLGGEKPSKRFQELDSFMEAYHQLIWELVQVQIKSINLALGRTKGIKTIFIDGGFAKNDVFCQMLKNELPAFEWKKTRLAAGSALGAAIAVNIDRFKDSHFQKILKVESI